MPKYKSPDGRVFDHILKAKHYFCHKDPCGTQFYCAECPIYIQSGEFPCEPWVNQHSAEAARLMGYEVIEEEKEKHTRASILNEAKRCVCGQREQDYGSPENNFRLIASLWEPYIRTRCVKDGADVSIRPEDVAMLMALLKIARICSGTGTADSFVDLAGYTACGGEIAGGRK